MKDLMIDIECLGKKYNSVITQVGLVYFDRYTGQLGKELSVNINIQDCLNNGLIIDGDTLKFWFEQTKLRSPSWLDNCLLLTKALQLIRDFYIKDTLVWAHATFDFPILGAAYNSINQRLPFPYRKLRDIRTLTDLSGIIYKKQEGIDPKIHDGLDDCKYQVKYCVECFNKLRNVL
jgi:hypothetical protein